MVWSDLITNARLIDWLMIEIPHSFQQYIFVCRCLSEGRSFTLVDQKRSLNIRCKSSLAWALSVGYRPLCLKTVITGISCAGICLNHFKLFVLAGMRHKTVSKLSFRGGRELTIYSVCVYMCIYWGVHVVYLCKNIF